jgi:hypothetical protein
MSNPAIGTASPAGYAPPRQSPGVLLKMTPQGYTQAPANKGGGSFNHPFRPLLSGDKLRFTRGLVSGFEPTIGDGKIPISGNSKNPPPALQLKPEDMDEETQQSWACIEVTPDKDGVISKADQIRLVHRKTPGDFFGTVGTQPLALILWRDKKPIRAIDLVWFNLRYMSVQPAPGRGGRRHFFL